MMRADPDIIMVGEIRDRETAQIAIEAALTGHLVLSTLHTNDAPTAITRLIEMGIEPFLVASAIDCVVAQRLARTLCPHCKQRTIIPAEALRDHGFRVAARHRGLRARRLRPLRRHRATRAASASTRSWSITEEIRRLAIERAPADQIAEVAVRDGMRRLRDDGLDKVMLGPHLARRGRARHGDDVVRSGVAAATPSRLKRSPSPRSAKGTRAP